MLYSPLTIGRLCRWVALRPWSKHCLPGGRMSPWGLWFPMKKIQKLSLKKLYVAVSFQHLWLKCSHTLFFCMCRRISSVCVICGIWFFNLQRKRRHKWSQEKQILTYSEQKYRRMSDCVVTWASFATGSAPCIYISGIVRPASSALSRPSHFQAAS